MKRVNNDALERLAAIGVVVLAFIIDQKMLALIGLLYLLSKL